MKKELAYSELKESEMNEAGWDKSTIEYSLKNESKIISIIRSMLRKKGRESMCDADVDAIYSNVLMYFYGASDYDMEKAYEKSHNDNIVTLEGYVHSCIKCCVLRYITGEYGYNASTVMDSVKSEEGDDISLFDSISSDEKVDVNIRLEELCEMYTSERYKYGVDIFEMLYVMVIIGSMNEHDERESDNIESVLNVLGLDKSAIKGCISKSEETNDNILNEISTAITKIGYSESEQILRKYVYSPDLIRAAFEG